MSRSPRTWGYIWIFPRNPEKQEVNLGVGILGSSDYDLKGLLEEYKREQRISGVVNYVIGGLVPLGLQYPLRHRNILFVGDAGVGSFPLSGQGIYRALLSGDIAGKCLAEHQPKKYTIEMQRLFMKWDIMGLFFLRANRVLRKAYPNIYIDSLDFLANRGKELGTFTHVT